MHIYRYSPIYIILMTSVFGSNCWNSEMELRKRWKWEEVVALWFFWMENARINNYSWCLRDGLHVCLSVSRWCMYLWLVGGDWTGKKFGNPKSNSINSDVNTIHCKEINHYRFIIIWLTRNIYLSIDPIQW